MISLTAWFWVSVCAVNWSYHLLYQCRNNLHLFVESISSSNAI